MPAALRTWPELIDLEGQVLLGIRHRPAGENDTLLAQVAGELGFGERLVDRGVDFLDHVLRRLARREHHVPGADLEPGQAGLGHGRDISRDGRPRRAGRCQRAQLAGADVVGIAVVTVSNIRLVWPPIVSFSAGALPL